MTGNFANAQPVLGAAMPTMPGVTFRQSNSVADVFPRIFNTAFGLASTFSESDARVTFTGATAATASAAIGIMPRSTGRYQFDFEMLVDAGNMTVGLTSYTSLPAPTFDQTDVGSNTYTYAQDRQKWNNGGSDAAYGAAWGTAGDILSVLADMNAATIAFALNGAYQGIAYSSLPAVLYVPSCGSSTGTTGSFRIVTTRPLISGFSRW